MSSERIKLGQWFEELAEADFLKRFSECSIIERNVRFRTGELDRVFISPDTLHFVEVRGRIQKQEPEIELSFPNSKRIRYHRVVQLYLAKNEIILNQKCLKHIRVWFAWVYKHPEQKTLVIHWYEVQ